MSDERSNSQSKWERATTRLAEVVQETHDSGHAMGRKTRRRLRKSEQLLDTMRSLAVADRKQGMVRRAKKRRRKLERWLRGRGIRHVIGERLPRDAVFVGVDLGGTNATVAAVDRRGTRLARRRIDVLGDPDADRVLAEVSEAICGVLDESETPRERCGGVGVGVPGPIDYERGVVLMTPAHGWRDVRVVDIIESATGISTSLDNDVNIGALGEWACGAGRGLDSMVGIFWGTGIGGGVILDGQLYMGADGMAGEVGHMVVAQDGPQCGCGARGCMEAIASRSAMTRAVMEASERGEETLLADRIEPEGDRPVIKSRAFREAWDAGDEVGRRIIETATVALGCGVANVINVLAPQAVVIGGGVTDWLAPVVWDALVATVNEHVISAEDRQVDVRPGRLSDDAGILGGAILAMKSWVERQRPRQDWR